MLPSIFGESLFDDWMGFPFRSFESDVDHKLYGKHAAHVMKTDLKAFARTVAMYAAGFVQLIVLFPLEKYILFK